MCEIESKALSNSVEKLGKRIKKLEKEPLAKLIKFGKNKKTVLVYDNRVEAIVKFFSGRLEKLERDKTEEIEEARLKGADEAYENVSCH